MSKPLTLFVLVCAPVPAAGARAQEAGADAARAEFFEARVRPVLVEHCYGCHNSTGDARGGLALDHRAASREESDSGTAVVPGDTLRSLVLQVVRHELPGLEMPKGGARLADDVIADLERWIRDGAYDPRDTPPTVTELSALTSWEATLARRKAWWSWQPIRAVAPPAASAWSDHPVDRFSAREHARQGLERAPEADRRTLLRRLAYTLTGLPPTPEELARFLADDRPDAYEREVERLLASPHYGERWARHWMDVVRYADSHGSEGDPAIPHAYQYRDYLIRAFNADVPYDQLVREHVAGDLLTEPRVDAELGIDESAIGTAHWRMVFHGFAPTDALQEKVRFVDDQINVLGKAFLATTISCARCHDHRFDAVSQADYYALFGVLGSCRPGMQDVHTAAQQALHQPRLAELKAALRAALAAAWAEAAASLPAATTPLAAHASDAHAAHTRRLDLGDVGGLRGWFGQGNGLAGGVSRAGDFALAPAGERVVTGVYPSGVYTHLLSTRHRGVLQSARIALEGESEAWVRAIGGGGAKLRYVVQDYPRGGTVYPITELAHPRWAWHRLDVAYWQGDTIHLELCTGQDAPVEVGGDERSWFGVSEVVLRPRGAGAPPEPPEPSADAESVRAAIEAWSRASATDDQALLLDACLASGALPNTLAALPELAGLVADYRALEASVPLPVRVPGLVEADAADQPLFVRGDHLKPAERVPRRFLEALDPTPYAAGSSGRLELAEDLLRPDNPLTARVITNRIWHHVFGRGLVATPDDFGRLGALPSHPELLDYLAARFVERGWSIKDMVRFLVTSRTWRLASSPAPSARERDPSNVWLSHARVRRLDAEALRDSLFVASGRLDRSLYGPGFEADSHTPRRSVYVLSRRNSLDAFLQTFDSPVPFAPTGARPATNVPAQSLALLNGALVRDVAAQWAGALRADPRFESSEARLRHMFEAVTGRAPEPAELQALSEYLAGGLETPPEGDDPWARVAHALFNLKEFLYVR